MGRLRRSVCKRWRWLCRWRRCRCSRCYRRRRCCGRNRRCCSSCRCCRCCRCLRRVRSVQLPALKLVHRGCGEVRAVGGQPALKSEQRGRAQCACQARGGGELPLERAAVLGEGQRGGAPGSPLHAEARALLLLRSLVASSRRESAHGPGGHRARHFRLGLGCPQLRALLGPGAWLRPPARLSTRTSRLLVVHNGKPRLDDAFSAASPCFRSAGKWAKNLAINT